MSTIYLIIITYCKSEMFPLAVEASAARLDAIAAQAQLGKSDRKLVELVNRTTPSCPNRLRPKTDSYASAVSSERQEQL
ncbi:MAG: hypothetical protein KME05_10525 [Gloeocapsa sp. UFS-A4-WI-NPMV-4B04]|nr:hypothetical protein [Gloeocapsa sp. UFS-A4-WI-NPMV-4B04]